MDFRLCDCNYAKLIFLNKLKKLNSNFKLLVGLVSNTPLIIQARSFLWPLLARLFYYLSNPGCLPIPYNFSVNGVLYAIFCFPLYQNAFVIEKDFDIKLSYFNLTNLNNQFPFQDEILRMLKISPSILLSLSFSSLQSCNWRQSFP